LGEGYTMDPAAFTWRFDAEAMRVLQGMAPLRSAAHAISERFGRRWLEAAVNGVRLGERQLPDVFRHAVLAARVVGLPYLPDIYVSGEDMWGARTLGSDTAAFVSLGSVLLNFRGDDLLFLLAREMGHARAGHALWRTAMEFTLGRQGSQTIMGEGILQFLNPAKLVESAFEAPLMAWARHSEITADRAGLLVVGKESVARRVLLQCTLKSFPVFSRIDPEAWRRQEDESDEALVRRAEWTLTSSPYVAPRLKLLREFAASPEFTGWRDVITYWTERQPTTPAIDAVAPPARQEPGGRPGGTVRLVCAACREPMLIGRGALSTGEPVNVRCPNPRCRKIVRISRKPRTPAPDTLASQD
jgi:hypothetical protein